MRRTLLLLLLLAPGLGCGAAASHAPDEITIRWTEEEEARRQPARPDASPSADRR